MRARLPRTAALLLTSLLAAWSATAQNAPPPQRGGGFRPDFDRMLQQQAATDQAWRDAAAGHMQAEKITYRSSAGDMDIPAWVFQPLTIRGPKQHPAIVWTHENIRGHLYEHYIPYIREATAKGYVVIAPEYRGSVGYGQAFYDAIDYGGKEVDDVVTAVDVLTSRYPAVDPARIGIMGWSHGGMITMLAITRKPAKVTAAGGIGAGAELFLRPPRE